MSPETSAQTKVKITKAVLLILVAVFLGTSISALVTWIKVKTANDIPVLGQMPQFTFTAEDGQPYGSTHIDGNIAVVNFFFTRCMLVCPAMNGNVARLYQEFSGYADLRFVSITVDPENDTLEVLQQYARNWEVHDGLWKFLRAEVKAVVKLSEEGFLLPADGLPMGHSAKLTLVDRRGRIRGYYSGIDEPEVAQLNRDIRRLLAAKP